MSLLRFIRHAQASYGAENYDQLSDLGLEQADVLGAYLAQRVEPFTHLYVGPLHRHHQTLDATLRAYRRAGRARPDVTELPELIEHKGPKVMGYAMPRLLATEPTWARWMAESEDDHALRRRYHLRLYDEVMRRWADGQLDHLEPPFQNWADFRADVARAVQRMLEENTGGAHIAAFSSGGTMSAAAGFALGMDDPVKIIDLNGRVFNTAYSTFLFSGERITLRTFNETPHFTEARWLTLV